MAGLLPDDVRLNLKRGYQAADLGYRILNHTHEMDGALAALHSNPQAVEILDLPRMVSIYQALKKEVNLQSTQDSGTILLRGMMVGLFLLVS